jgi:nickel-dependent lactate racemase
LEFWLPYGTTDVPIAIPDENLLGFLTPLEDSTSHNLEDVVSLVLQQETGGSSFIEAAMRARKPVIAFNGKSAASSRIADLLLQQLLQRGVQGIRMVERASDPTQPISGRESSENDLRRPDLSTKHAARTSPTLKLGQLDDGSDLLLNETFADGDLRCIVTDVSVNPFWGYSGGPSFVMPGLASEKTIKACLAPSLKAERLPGVLSGNTTYVTVLRAAQAARIDLAIHVVERPDGRVAAVFAGDFQATFEQACLLSGRLFRPRLRRKADIVISSAGGTPYDRTLFDASPSAIMAASICKDHGILILTAECSNGRGAFPSGGFAGRDPKARFVHSRRAFSLETLLEYSLLRVSSEHRTYLVSTLPERQASSYGLLAAKSIRSALERAIRHAGREASVAVIPYGSHTAPQVDEASIVH